MSDSRLLPSFVLNSEQAKQLYYTTTTAEAYVPLNLVEGKGENFIDVHGIGQRTGKYYKYQRSRAPLLDRSSVYYYTDYVVLPLDDAPVTRALAKENKLRSNPGFGAGSAAKFDDKTTHKEAFHRCTRTEARRAKQKSCKPQAGLTTTLPSGDLLEKRSVTHEVFGLPVRISSEAAKPPRPNLFLGVRAYPPSTSYGDAFRRPATAHARASSSSSCSSKSSSSSRPASAVSRSGERARPRRCQSAPAGGRGSSESERLRWQQRLALDEEILKMRRVPYMSPGQ